MTDSESGHGSQEERDAENSVPASLCVLFPSHVTACVSRLKLSSNHSKQEKGSLDTDSECTQSFACLKRLIYWLLTRVVCRRDFAFRL